MIDVQLAYIDPGTGSLLVSTLIGVVLSSLFALRGLFYKIISRFTGNARHLNNDFSGRLVFFTEGQRYWNVFEPVVKALIEKEQPFVYITADENDEGLKLNNGLCEAHYIGGMKQAIVILNRLKARVCVMTTPQLDIVSLRRSKDVSHYCFLPHSPVDIHYYKKYAFDRYDSVLCANNHQIINLRQLENKRGSKKKELYETGCSYYDYSHDKVIKKGDAILVAPTWGDKSFVSKYGKQIIKKILEAGYQVIFRPHPQSFTVEKEALEEIISAFETDTKFHLDDSADNKQALSNSYIVLCSMSGLVFDSIIDHKLPTIVVDLKWDTRGWEYYSLENISSTHLLLEEAGKVIPENEIDNIVSVIKEVENMEVEDDIQDQYIFNYKSAGKVAAEQIYSIYNKLKD